MVVPVDVSAETIVLNLSPPSNQTELTGLITRVASETSNVTAAIVGGTYNLDATYNIWSQLCVPAGFESGGVVEFTIHGYVVGLTYPSLTFILWV